MATFKKRIEYIASTSASPARFTLENFNITPSAGDVIEVETENQYTEVPSTIRYLFNASYTGMFYAIQTNGLFTVGDNSVQDNAFFIDTTSYHKLNLKFEYGSKVSLYIDDDLRCHRLTNLGTGTIAKFCFMWGRGTNPYKIAHKKKYIKIWHNGVLVYDYIPVLDDNDVPCWYNRVSKELLYADTGYTPTVYGDEVPMYASEVEYIGSNNNARFTISNLGVTTSNTLLIESDIKWINYPNSINGEYRLDLVGGWQGANSSGKWILASGVAGGDVSTTEFQNEKFLIDNINQKTTIFVNNEESVSRTINPLTIDYVNVFYGTYGATTYYANNLKKYIKVFVDDKLKYDFIPVVDIDGVPAFYDKVTNTMLYADAGYVPTIVGGVVNYECGNYLRERQLLIANKGILPYYCELEYISYPTLFSYDMTVTATSVIEIETAIKYLGSIGGGNQLEGNSTAGRWYGIDDYGNYTLGGGITSTTPASTTGFDKIYNVQNLGTAINTLNVNGVDILTRTGIAQTTSLTYGMFGVAAYKFNVSKKYHKVWIDGELVYDYIPVLDYDGVPCWYNRVDGQFLYAETGQTPTVWGREIHPIERIHCNKNYYYNIVSFLNFDDTLGCKVLIESDSSGNASNIFLGAGNGVNAFTITYNQNGNLVYRWFSTTFQYTAGLAERDTIQEIEFNKSHIVVNGTEATNITSDLTTLDNCRLLGANNTSAMLGWLYNCWIKNPFGAYKMYLIPFVDETGTAGLFDTITRTILEKYASGVPTYDPIELDYVANTVLTNSSTGGAYAVIPYQPNNNTQIECRLRIFNDSVYRYLFGSASGYSVAHGTSTKRLTINEGSETVYIDLTNINDSKRISINKNIVEINNSNTTILQYNEFTESQSLRIGTAATNNQSIVGGFNWFQIGENNSLLFNLIPAIKDGQIGLLDTFTNTLYPSQRAGVPFVPHFFPQRKMFDPYTQIDYFSITIDLRRIVNNYSYDFVNNYAGTNDNYVVDWGDGVIEKGGTSHTYAEAKDYEIKFIPLTDAFTWLRFSTGQSTKPSCLISVNKPYPKMPSTTYDVPNWFTGCTNLVSICEDFLQNNRHITNLASMFYTCSKLPAIGKNFFKGMTKLRALSYAFRDTKLAEIPAGLLDDCNDLRIVEHMFANTPITSIPAGLFDNISKSSTMSFAVIFFGTNITSVPQGLFDGFTNVTSISRIFNNCQQLETLPDLLFKDMRNLKNISYAFTYCNALQFNANLFCDEATDMATHFTNSDLDFSGAFNRTTWTGTTQGTAPQLWNYTISGTPTTTGCFGGAGNNASSLTNYASIPSAWGGPA